METFRMTLPKNIRNMRHCFITRKIFSTWLYQVADNKKTRRSLLKAAGEPGSLVAVASAASGSNNNGNNGKARPLEEKKTEDAKHVEEG